MADPRCPRCGVPLLDQPDYCWSCGFYVGDRWRSDQLTEGQAAQPRVVGQDEGEAARPVADDTAGPVEADRGGTRSRRRPEITVRTNPWIVRLVALAVVVIVVLLALSWFGRSASSSAPSGPASVLASVPGTASVSAASGPALASATAVGARPSASALAPTGPTTRAKVTRVVDGDTIIVVFGGSTSRVRYIGMDTPESVKPDTPVEPMAKEAAAANRALVDGHQVVLERDVSDTDRFGRLLRDVWVERDGALVLVGLELVRGGYAQVATFPPDVKYVDELLAAQRRAREAGLGLWATN